MCRITDKITEHGAYRYGYDNLNRLASAENSTLANEVYTYDARLTAAETGETLWDYDDSNQLIQAGLQRVYGYDANGSMDSKTEAGITQSLTYNLENRLSEVRAANDDVVATYHYDPFGRRVAKTTNGETRYFHYSDEGINRGRINRGQIPINRLSVTASGSGRFTFAANCSDSCNGDTWTESFSVDVSATYRGNAAVPGVCGALALASRFPGRTGNSPGRNRAVRAAQWGCAMVMARNVGTVGGAAYRHTENIINNRAAELINYYLNLGATAICQGSR